MPVTQIVGHDQDDVGLGDGERRQQASDKDRENFHFEQGITKSSRSCSATELPHFRNEVMGWLLVTSGVPVPEVIRLTGTSSQRADPSLPQGSLHIAGKPAESREQVNPAR